jgi:hypothetical protein
MQTQIPAKKMKVKPPSVPPTTAPIFDDRFPSVSLAVGAEGTLNVTFKFMVEATEGPGVVVDLVLVGYGKRGSSLVAGWDGSVIFEEEGWVPLAAMAGGPDTKGCILVLCPGTIGVIS